MAAADPWQEAGKPGVHVWRIENFRPVYQSDPKQLGRFYTGDSYLVLHTTVASAGGHKAYTVHFWLGSRSTQDEAGAAAILATELDDALGGKAKQFRSCAQQQSHESEEFTQLFGESLHYLQGGIASGFHHVTPEKHRPCLLHIKGKKGVRVTEVPLAAASLNSGDVFVTDLGERIFVWAGAACNPDEKVKALEVVEARRADRNGQAEVVHVAEGEKSADAADFFLALGEQSSTVAIAPAAAAGADEAAAAAASAAADARLFRVAEGAAPKELEQRPLMRALLQPTAAYVLVAGSAVQIWQGSGASAGARGASLASAHELLPALGLPPSTPVSLVKQGFEDPAFTKHFEGWGPNGAVAPSPGANGTAASPGPPTAALGQRRSSGHEAVFGNGAAAAVDAANGASSAPRPASGGAKQLPARPGPASSGAKPALMQRGPAEPSQEGLAEGAPPAPPATPPPSGASGPKAGGGAHAAETPQRVSGGAPDRGAPAPATPAANGRPASAPKSVPAKTVGASAKDGDAPTTGDAAPPGEAAATAVADQVTGGMGEAGGAATAPGSNGSGAEVRKLLDGFKAPLPERDTRPLPRLRPNGAARGAISSVGSGDQPFTPKPFVPEVTKPPRVAENLKYVPGKDVLPYAELKKLRVEDGVDMLRREAYLSDAEFETVGYPANQLAPPSLSHCHLKNQVFAKPRGDFAKLPKWRQQMAKKGVGLF